ncbi:MAG: hypothetical protein K5985_10665 [Lachnospiraceae bacterium]|nr:hypothetical protein [Lachnospiraceae bacterium]
MELKSAGYCAFVFAALLVYFCFHKNRTLQRNVILVSSALLIVSLTNVPTLLLMLFIALTVFILGLAIEKSTVEGNMKKARCLMFAGVFFVLGILIYFKFFTFTFEALRRFAAGRGVSFGELVFPVGLSYYALSMTAYLIDIYHKKHGAEKSFPDILEFFFYFPSITEGPINLYAKTMPQLKEAHSFDSDRCVLGLLRILWGYIKKVVIADRIGILVTGILSEKENGGFILFFAMLLYSFQIYTDFSGGIDVIMGVSEILGVKLTENFRAPLVSKSVTEFWQRWHMSLGEFMEKYVYYPIVLNKRVMKLSKKVRWKYLQRAFSATLASVIVFILVGIWHGTGWNYVVYGCFQAFFVSQAVLLAPVWKNARAGLKINDAGLSYRILTALRTFLILTFGRYFIKAANLSNAVEMLRRTFTEWRFSCLFDGSLLHYGLDIKNLYLMYFSILLIIIADILAERKVSIRSWILSQDRLLRYMVYLAGVFFVIIFGIYGKGYDSTTFIYQAF